MKVSLVLTLMAALIAGPALAEEAAGPAKPDLAKGQAISSQVCASCHANDGSRGAPTYPILQGQHPDYIVKQLQDFKEGKRQGGQSAIMKGFASALSPEDMRNVAAFYATKQAKGGFAKNKDLVSLGEKIYRGGIAERHVPACAGCHSPSGAGIPAQFPRLGGQHADYTSAQLTNFRAHQRSNGPMMVSIASQLNDTEIQALADYIAGLH